ncbi:hypothetical protein [Branchiibius cervicis]|uniref:Uncharacterized protein n=1 Tax=Branchiibius cervicis TaxID=908252 RepID=A0ABW2ART5_9MICO
MQAKKATIEPTSLRYDKALEKALCSVVTIPREQSRTARCIKRVADLAAGRAPCPQ